MKESPILMNAEMVRATLEKRKTQTRRPIKKAWDGSSWAGNVHPAKESGWIAWWPGNVDPEFTKKVYDNGFPCPYGQPGDRLFITQSSSSTKKQTFESRFWERVYKFDDCWEWFGKVNRKAYGMIGYNGKNISSQRASWLIHYGEIPKDNHVLHHCDLPWCVNPDHLYLGNNTDNINDKLLRGRITKKFGQDNKAAKLSDNDVLEIKTQASSGIAQYTIAHQFGVNQSQISRILSGKRRNGTTVVCPTPIGHRTPEIVVVRVERLREITGEDCIKEGMDGKLRQDYGLRYAFGSGWNSMYAKKPEYQWEANPWVWVIEFAYSPL